MHRHHLKALILISLILTATITTVASAQTQTSSGNVIVSGLVPLPPPTIPAIIDQPTDGNRFTTALLVVRGTCGANLLVRVFNNNELAGSINCASDGTFAINITLNSGQNILKILNYDILNQPGPASANIIVFLDIVDQNKQEQIAISNSGIITNIEDQLSDEQRLFEGTFVEPISRVFGIDQQVSPKTNQIIGNTLNILFVFFVIFLVILLLT